MLRKYKYAEKPYVSAGELVYVEPLVDGDDPEWYVAVTNQNDGGYFFGHRVRTNVEGDLVVEGTDLIPVDAVLKVYGVPDSVLSVTDIDDVINERLNDRVMLYWEGKPMREMTVAEICKELGYEVKVVKEH